MKKLLIGISALTLIVSFVFVGCGNKMRDENGTTSSTTESTTSSTTNLGQLIDENTSILHDDIEARTSTTVLNGTTDAPTTAD